MQLKHTHLLAELPEFEYFGSLSRVCLQYKPPQLECAAGAAKHLSNTWGCGRQVLECIILQPGNSALWGAGVTGTLNWYKITKINMLTAMPY